MGWFFECRQLTDVKMLTTDQIAANPTAFVIFSEVIQKISFTIPFDIIFIKGYYMKTYRIPFSNAVDKTYQT
jgi:hypothetical protein